MIYDASEDEQVFARGSWNPRYLAYCAAMGYVNPTDAMEHDREKWPGGHMAGFIIWMGQQWRAFFSEMAYTQQQQRFLGDDDHRRFDHWLADRITSILSDRGQAL